MMRAKIVCLDRNDPDEEQIKEAGEIILKGGLVAFPTETVYGLGGNALDPEASNKIYTAKGRPSDNPLIVHIASWEDLDKIVKEIPKKARILGEKCWPGPLTMIFNKKDIVPKETTGGLDTVAVRFPSHPVARKLILASGGYIAAPSANISGRPSPTKAEHVIEDLADRIDMIIDSGETDIGLESTIVDFTSENPVILRPGFYSEEDIREIIGDIEVDRALIKNDSRVKPKAPGMKYRHYAPKGDLTVVEGERGEVIDEINRLIKEHSKQGQKTAVLCSDETKDRYMGAEVISLGSLLKEDEIAHHLFDVLRTLDSRKVEVIYSEAFYTQKIGEAIMNRLLKAAGHKVIDLKNKR
jgi:L-threonylcarbamoyladenylate synthase